MGDGLSALSQHLGLFTRLAVLLVQVLLASCFHGWIGRMPTSAAPPASNSAALSRRPKQNARRAKTLGPTPSCTYPTCPQIISLLLRECSLIFTSAHCPLQSPSCLRLVTRPPTAHAINIHQNAEPSEKHEHPSRVLREERVDFGSFAPNTASAPAFYPSRVLTSHIDITS
jgi:hypothetical protein